MSKNAQWHMHRTCCHSPALEFFIQKWIGLFWFGEKIIHKINLECTRNLKEKIFFFFKKKQSKKKEK